jgi:hypothetical protein
MFCDECVYVGDLLKKNPEDDNVVSVTQDTERFIFTVSTSLFSSMAFFTHAGKKGRDQRISASRGSGLRRIEGAFAS